MTEQSTIVDSRLPRQLAHFQNHQTAPPVRRIRLRRPPAPLHRVPPSEHPASHAGQQWHGGSLYIGCGLKRPGNLLLQSLSRYPRAPEQRAE